MSDRCSKVCRGTQSEREPTTRIADASSPEEMGHPSCPRPRATGQTERVLWTPWVWETSQKRGLRTKEGVSGACQDTEEPKLLGVYWTVGGGGGLTHRGSGSNSTGDPLSFPTFTTVKGTDFSEHHRVIITPGSLFLLL